MVNLYTMKTRTLRTFGSLAIMIIIVTGLSAQTLVTGRVIERGQVPIIGANIFIEGSYDGGITDERGTFSFSTTMTGPQVLSVSYLGYESIIPIPRHL